MLLFKTKDFHWPHSTLYSLHKEWILTALLQGTVPRVLFCVLGSSARQVWPSSQRTLSLAHPVMFWNIEFDEEPHLSCPSPKLKAASKTGNAKNPLLAWTSTKAGQLSCDIHIHIFISINMCSYMSSLYLTLIQRNVDLYSQEPIPCPPWQISESKLVITYPRNPA